MPGQNYLTVLKIEHPVMCLATMAYVYAACTACVTIFRTGGKFQLASNLQSYTSLTLAAPFLCALGSYHISTKPGSGIFH